jgi:hypothetical protein
MSGFYDIRSVQFGVRNFSTRAHNKDSIDIALQYTLCCADCVAAPLKTCV